MPFLSELRPHPERHAHLVVTDEVGAKLLELEPQTSNAVRYGSGYSTSSAELLFEELYPA